MIVPLLLYTPRARFAIVLLVAAVLYTAPDHRDVFAEILLVMYSYTPRARPGIAYTPYMLSAPIVVYALTWLSQSFKFNSLFRKQSIPLVAKTEPTTARNRQVCN